MERFEGKFENDSYEFEVKIFREAHLSIKRTKEREGRIAATRSIIASF